MMVKHPGHLTSMKKERGAGTRVCFFGTSFSFLLSKSVCLRLGFWILLSRELVIHDIKCRMMKLVCMVWYDRNLLNWVCTAFIAMWWQTGRDGNHSMGKAHLMQCPLRTLSLCFRASAPGVGFRRSTARTYIGKMLVVFT